MGTAEIPLGPRLRHGGTTRRWLVAILAVLGATLSMAVTARADTTAATGDESVSAPTSWKTLSGLTTAQLATAIPSGYRPVDLRQAPDGTYTVVAVSNSGHYAVSGWWWYVHVDQTTTSNNLSSNNARLISAQRNSDGTLNTIMVSNTGTAARTWWWYSGVSIATINSALSANTGRLVSWEPDASGGTYTAVMVANTGSDAKGWWWYLNQSVSQISSELSTNNARLVDIAPDPGGGFDVIMVAQSGTDNLPWKWYVGTSAAAITNIANQTGYRVFKLVPYTSGGSTVYAGLMINNLNAEAHRIESLLESGYSQQGLSGANFGFELQPMGGSNTLALQPTAKFEPASAIKALYNAYGELQVQLGNDSLSNSLNYWYAPTDPTNSNVCPLNYANTSSNESTTTVGNALDQMMGISDNRMTQAIDLHYGRSNVNALGRIIGMSHTKINQTLGCGSLNGGYVTTALYDLGKLYTNVWQNDLLNATRAASFFGRMDGGTLSSSDPLATVINQEASAAGKSADASTFIGDVTYRDKGGSYDECPASGACSPPYVYDRADAGVITLPFKSAGSVVGHTFVYGWFVNNLSIPCPFSTTCAARTQADNTTNQVRAELMRAQVKAALATW